MANRESVKIVSGALDEGPDGEIILRGVVDPSSLSLLLVAPYQREILPMATIATLVRALELNSVPDIELGMRGQRFIERDGAFYLQDDVYIVDGLQRVTAAKTLVEKGGPKPPRIGAAIHFETSEAWERARFKTLNADRTKLAPSILVRNMRGENPAVEAVYTLTTADKDFVLYDRIAWGQRMGRQELFSALVMLKVVARLHSRFGSGRSGRMDHLLRGITGIMEKTGRNTFRDNIRTFFDLIDQCWGIRKIQYYKEGAVYIRGAFMMCLADVFGRHKEFWRDGRLVVDRDIVRKLATFDVVDPQVASLAGAGSSGAEILYDIMIRHLNSGRRTRRLVRHDGDGKLSVGQAASPVVSATGK